MANDGQLQICVALNSKLLVGNGFGGILVCRIGSLWVQYNLWCCGVIKRHSFPFSALVPVLTLLLELFHCQDFYLRSFVDMSRWSSLAKLCVLRPSISSIEEIKTNNLRSCNYFGIRCKLDKSSKSTHERAFQTGERETESWKKK